MRYNILNNEITVKLNCDIKEICQILKSIGFQCVEHYLLDDTYYIPNTIDIKKLTEREILKNAIILRDVTGYMEKYKITKLTYKKKEIDEQGQIIKQGKVECSISNKEEGSNFLKAINYFEIMNIKEIDTVFKKEGLEIYVKDVINGDKLIEIEECEKFDTIDKIKQELERLNLPVDTNDYFIKKAEVELKKVL